MMLGEILTQPELRFDYSSTYAKDVFSKRGLYRFGPYDSELLGKDVVKCALLYPSEYKDIIQDTVVRGLIEGEGRFGGFESLFKIPIEFVEDIAYSEEDVDILLQQVVAKDLDFVFFILEKNKPWLYKKSKLTFLTNSIPSQMISVNTLRRNRQGLQFILENIALATYAKIGGTPWTISTKEETNDLVMGVSRGKDEEGWLVGFVTIFTHDGDFLFMNSKAPVIRWEEYVSGLSRLIEESIHEYEIEKGTPDKIILHLSKKPGKGELEAIQLALNSVGIDSPYAIIHINEYSNYRVFDSAHQSYAPPKGLMIRLSSHEALLINKGRVNGWTKIGVPRVLNIRMDSRSTLEFSEFLRLVKQMYDLSYINWRGFNAETIPATLNYSKLIARLIADLGAEKWNDIVAGGRLRDKSWYL